MQELAISRSKANLCLKSITMFFLSILSGICNADFDYRFHWGRLAVAQFNLELPTNDSQVVQVSGSTVGVVGTLFNYDGAMQSDYSDPQSTLFELSGLDGSFEEHRSMRFYADRPAKIIDFLDDEIAQPTDSLVEAMGITSDPLRIVADLAAGSAGALGTEICRGDYSVFDGKRHYRLSLQELGYETLQADRQWSYSGSSIKCEVQVTYLLAASGNEQNPWYEDREDTRIIWLAEINNNIVPVRISMAGPFGRVVGRLDYSKI